MKYQEEVISILEKHLLEVKKKLTTVHIDSNLKNDLDLDSLDVVEILINFEKNLELKIPTDSIISFYPKTVKDILIFIENHEANK
jgi:acyl carrier protein